MNRITPPTVKQLEEYCKVYGFEYTPEQMKEVQTLVTGSLKPYELLSRLPDNQPKVEYPRSGSWEPEDNEFNAWYVKCDIKGAPEGKLKGKTFGIKDNVCVAGVAMMNGSHTMEGYVPNMDATIVTRILKAGGNIIGKTHCEDLCLSGGSHTNFKAPVLNPHNKEYVTGGSSSGSGAVVAGGQADMSIACDQGGSIRMPACWCGVYGLKPTYGLVPYTGIMTIEYTIDSVGPISKTVRENATFLEVLAGPDGLDGRQHLPRSMSFDYTSTLEKGVKGLKIGRLVQGFAKDCAPQVQKDTSSKVDEALQVLKSLGAEIIDISVPFHEYGLAIWSGIALEGSIDQMMKGNGVGTGHRGLSVTSLAQHFAGWKNKANAVRSTNYQVLLIRLLIFLYIAFRFVQDYLLGC